MPVNINPWLFSQNNSPAIFGDSSNTWYVRPSGGTYGDEDGTSYDNAWDGFTNIDWTATGVQPGDTLYIAGTHAELLTVGGSGADGSVITIRGDYSEAAGVIDGEDTRDECLVISTKNYITVSNISLIDALVSCSNVDGTSTGINFSTVTASGSGNQGFQNGGSVSVAYTNCIAADNIDDGFSCHEAANITIIGGTISGNSEGVGIIADSIVSVTGAAFTGNTTYDLSTQAATGAETAIITANSCILNKALLAQGNGKLILNNCRVNDTLNVGGTGAGFGVFTDTRFQGKILTSNGSAATATFNRCLFDGTGKSDHMIDCLSASTITYKYCVFTNIPSAKTCLTARAGAVLTVNNCTFFDGLTASDGNGLTSFADITINNVLVQGLNIALFRVGGTYVANNTSFYNNTTDKNGTITDNNPQTGDPSMTDPANEDFSLSGSSTITGDGVTVTGYEMGIASANWGNATTVPVVTTKTQAVAWDIGAYIS